MNFALNNVKPGYERCKQAPTHQKLYGCNEIKRCDLRKGRAGEALACIYGSK